MPFVYQVALFFLVIFFANVRVWVGQRVKSKEQRAPEVAPEVKSLEKQKGYIAIVVCMPPQLLHIIRLQKIPGSVGPIRVRL